MERASRAKGFDLEAVETALREAVLSAGARVLGELISGIGSGRRKEELKCGCGARMESKGLKEKTVLTILGETRFLRSMYECPQCGISRYPGDEELDVEGTSRSPGLRRMMARAGSKETFKEGSEDLRVYAGIMVSPKDVERVSERIGMEIEEWLSKEREELVAREEPVKQLKTIPILYVSYDGTGVPMIPGELMGRKGKQPDGSAKTREAKLGCIFTQTTTDEDGRPVRDPGSTTFVGAIETAEEFGKRIYAEAVRRGLYKAKKVVVLGDGARWIRGLAELHFSMATQIIDLYHAREHISDLCKLLFDANQKKITDHRTRWWTDLDEGNVEKIALEAKKKLFSDPELREKAETEIAYFEENKERMRYSKFREEGLFVGSGVVEAGCKTIVGKRLKQSGMEWSVPGANSILSLRCNFLSNRMEDFWESRAS